jgi:hypothetical protein
MHYIAYIKQICTEDNAPIALLYYIVNIMLLFILSGYDQKPSILGHHLQILSNRNVCPGAV